MKNLSIQEQKQIVGGYYYFKIFTTSGIYLSGSKSDNYYDLGQCMEDAKEDAQIWGAGYCARVYDTVTGQMWQL